MSKIITYRIVAFFIDSVVLSFINMIILNITGFKENIKISEMFFLGREWIVNFSISFFIFILYFLLFDFFSNGISFGKKIFNLSVQSEFASSSIFYKRTLLKALFFYSPLMIILIIYYINKNTILYDDLLKIKVKKNIK